MEKEYLISVLQIFSTLSVIEEGLARGTKSYFRNQNGYRFKKCVKVFSNNLKIRKANGQLPVGDSGMFCHNKGEWWIKITLVLNPWSSRKV